MSAHIYDSDSFNKYCVYLEITTWQGLSIGAEHYYGKLCGYNKGEHISVELKKVMTREDARILNKKDSAHCWEEGETTDRFDTEEGIKKIARKEWKKHFPQAKIVVEGREGVIEPQPIFVGPSDYKRKINAWAKKAEEINYWDNEKVMEALCSKWERLSKQYFAAWNKKT